MIRLALLLLGPDFIRTRWPLLALVAALWAALGIAILIDSFRGVVWFPTHLLGYLLILEALITLVATTSRPAIRSGLTAVGSSDRITRSASLPGAMDPRTSSE